MEKTTHIVQNNVNVINNDERGDNTLTLCGMYTFIFIDSVNIISLSTLENTLYTFLLSYSM